MGQQPRAAPGLSVFAGHGVSTSAPGGQKKLALQGAAAAPGGPKLPRTGMQSTTAEAPAGEAVLGGQDDGLTAPTGQKDPAGQSETSLPPGGPKYPATLCHAMPILCKRVGAGANKGRIYGA